jgi:Family of unknown function (DUF695)
MASESNVAMWSTAKSTHNQNGRVIIFRFAHEFRSSFDRTTQPYRIIIVWRYESETGQPSRDEYQRMNLLEDTLGPVLFEGEFATLALVSTGENLHEWIYYARSDDEFMDRLNHALTGEVFPIEIHTAADPTWESYEAFINGLKVPQAD